MTERSRLDEIEDYQFAVGKFVHQGKSKEQVTDLLIKRGAGEIEIESIFDSIFKNYPGIRLLESSAAVRAVNFLVDSVFLLLTSISLFSQVEEGDRLRYSVLILVIIFAYFVLTEGTCGQTLGKLVTNSIVVKKDGNKIGFETALIRTIGRFFPKAILAVFFNDRAFHDNLSETYVVDKKRWVAIIERMKLPKVPRA